MSEDKKEVSFDEKVENLMNSGMSLKDAVIKVHEEEIKRIIDDLAPTIERNITEQTKMTYDLAECGISIYHQSENGIQTRIDPFSEQGQELIKKMFEQTENQPTMNTNKTYIAKEPVTAIKGGGIDASIRVGEEVVFDEKTGYYKSAKGLFLLKDRVENNPEYWEEKLTTINNT